jgi:hypothetical protein
MAYGIELLIFSNIVFVEISPFSYLYFLKKFNTTSVFVKKNLKITISIFKSFKFGYYHEHFQFVE